VPPDLPDLVPVAVDSVSGAASALPVAVAADKAAVSFKAVVEALKAAADKVVGALLPRSRASGSEALIALSFTFYVFNLIASALCLYDSL
jgi:hypothetical protein